MNSFFSNTELILATPRGFCAGVERAVDIVNKAIDVFGAPIYVKHEVVHNKHVIEDLEKKGVIFIEDVMAVPEGSIIIYSAHGVSIKVKNDAKKRNLKIFDATCPLVTKVHLEVHKYSKDGVDVILIGHKGHPEIEGTMGQYDSAIGHIHLVESEEDLVYGLAQAVARFEEFTLLHVKVEHDDFSPVLQNLAQGLGLHVK